MEPSTLSAWEAGDTLHLLRNGTIADERGYLLLRWEPTPVTSPWNNGAGYEKDATPLTDIEESTAWRLADFRTAIATGRLARLQPDKSEVLMSYRNNASERALEWLDACWADRPDGSWTRNPLLGSGGNDARLDFSRTYQRALAMVMDLKTGAPTPKGVLWLDHLLGLTTERMPASDLPGGQFFGGSTVNPWAFLLAIEGCLFFGGGAWRHDVEIHRWPNTAAFCPAGIASGPGDAAESSDEHWWPVWRTPCSVTEIKQLLGDHCLLKFGGTAPITGLDYAIAAATDQRRWNGEVLRVTRRLTNGQAHLMQSEMMM